MKRFLSLFLFAILFGCYAFSYDFSARCSSGQTLYYNITSSTEPYTVEVTSQNTSYPYYPNSKPSGSLTIPSSIAYNDITYSITSVGKYAFYNCNGLTSVSIPSSVTSIGNYTFGHCSALTGLAIPNSVTNIGEGAFYGCSGLTSITIPNSVINFGGAAFHYCSGLTRIDYTGTIAQWCEINFLEDQTYPRSSNPLYYAHNLYINNSLVTDLIVPNTITKIKYNAFCGATCLSSVTISNSVDSIGDYAFSGCSGLTSITIPNSVTNIGIGAFNGCNGLASVVIPNSVTSISPFVFYNCNGLTEVTIPNSVTSIEQSAFYNCNGLTEVTIPNSVTSIGHYVFYNCNGLTEVTIPNSVTSIGSSAFSNCTGLTTVIFNATNCTAMGNSDYPVFNGCPNLSTLTIGNDVTKIPAYAFKNCSNLATVNFNATNCTSMGNSSNPVFSECTSLATLTIGNNVTNIPASAFYNCSGLTSVTIPNSVTSIGQSAFDGCSGLTSITIPNHVSSISNYAFSNCSGLRTINFNAANCTSFGYNTGISGNTNITTLNIGENVTTIPNSAFQNCSGLTTINFNATNCTSMGSSSYPVFNGCNANTTINIGEGVTAIPDYAFKGLIGNGTLTIPNSVTSIGQSAFYGCSGLTGELSIPESVTGIGSSTFYNCSGLTSVTIPNSVTNIGTSAFQNCGGLTTVNFNATNCVTIGNSSYPVFSGCTSLATLNIGENVTNIPAYAFKGCSSLSSVTIPNSVTNIDSYAFNNCSGLSALTIGSGIASIGSSAFAGCNALAAVHYAGNIGQWCGITFDDQPLDYAHNLYINNSLVTDLVIPENITEINNNTFSGATCLTSATIPNTVTSIGQKAFYGCSGLSGTLTVPNSVSSIGNQAFGNCNGLTAVNFNAANCSTMGSSSNPAFGGCTSLSTISIGENVRSIPANAFYNCNSLRTINFNATNCTSFGSNNGISGNTNITALNIGENVTNIPSSAFNGCTNITGALAFPNAVTSIGTNAFYNCNAISSLSIGSSASSIGSNAFYNCSGLTSITVDASNTTYDSRDNCNAIITKSNNSLILGCNNTVIPETIRSIGSSAFYNCSALRSVTIPQNLTSIANDVFYGCSAISEVIFNAAQLNSSYTQSPFSAAQSSLKKISLGEGVTRLPNYMFAGCTALDTIIANSTVPPTIYSSTFDYNHVSSARVLVPCRTADIYNDADFWYNFRRIREVGPCPTIYTVTALSNNNLFGTVTGGGEYEENSTATLSATPNYGYRFTAWNDGNEENPRTISVSNDVTYIATFVEIPPVATYTITALSSNPTIGVVTGGGSYYEGTEVTLTATPSEGYAFVSWNDGETLNPRQITVSGDALYIASFIEANVVTNYEINVASSNLAFGTVSGSGIYSLGNVVEISATAFDGYMFTSWNDGNTENPRSITVIGNAMYVANFAVIPPTPVYTITAMSINQAYGMVLGGGEYEENTVATLTATAADGYEFTSWNDGNTENPREVTVTRDAIYIAYFDELPSTPTYNITVIASNPNHGEVTGGGVYEENTEITLTATSFDGYRFDIWSDGNTDSIRTVTVTSDAIYIANFVHIDEAETIYVTVIDTACGSYTWNGVTYTESGTYYRTFTATNSADSIVALGLVILPLPEPVITVDGILDACNQETTSVTLSAGNYSSYNWTTGETSSSIVVTTPGEYYVEVVDSMGCQGISEGVIVGYSTTLTEAPQIRKAGVKKNDNEPYFVAVNWSRVQGEGVVGYNVYREDAATNVFRFVKRVTTFSLIDSTVDPSARAYRYKVCAVDECGGLSPMSEPHKTIHLTINKGIGNAWNLIWSHYEGTPVRSYKIYRGTNRTNMSVIAEVPGTQNSYTDYDNPDCIGYYYKIDFVANTRSDGDEEDMMLSSNVVDNGHIVMHTVMAASSNPAHGTVSGSGTYPNETVIELEATANNGYEFASWSDGNTENPRSVTITSDTLFIANFVEIQQVATYTITVYSSNPAYGTVSGGGTYAEGTEIQLVASANNGYEFVAWSDGNRDNPRSITVTEDAMYIATFAEAAPIVTYTVTVISANPSQGTVTGGGTYPEGTEITIEAIAAEGYEFISWDDNNTENPRIITVTADAMFIASFAPATDIEESAITEINVFPNPVTNILNITSSETISEIEIINVMGQIVKRVEVNSDNVACDVENLISGMYVVRIYSQNGDTSQRKFIKK